MMWLRRWLLGVNLRSIAVARLKPGDVIVVEMDGLCGQTEMATIEAQLRVVWPGHRVVVLDDDTSIRIVRPDGEGAPV